MVYPVVQLVLVVSSAFVLIGECALIINKCCPSGQEFVRGEDTFDEYDCAPKNSSRAPGDMEDFSWFPIELLTNSTSPDNQTADTGWYLKILQENYRVRYGSVPMCDELHRKRELIGCDDGIECSRHFRLLLEKDNVISPYLTSRYYFDAKENAAKEAKESFMKRNMSETCFDSVRGRKYGFVVFHCFCQSLTCITKCCEEGYIFSTADYTCVPSNGTDDWLPENVNHSHYFLPDNFPACDSMHLIVTGVSDQSRPCTRHNKSSENKFHIRPDGSVKINKYPTPDPSHFYCGEIAIKDGMIYEQSIVLCRLADNPLEQLRNLVYGILLILGGMCLLVTVLISLYLPELRRRLHNKIALSHNICLMIAYFAWGSTKLGSKDCVFDTLIIQYTFLGSFFWLNVMCIDIALTFSQTKTIRGSTATGEAKKFTYYSLYCWGTPALISITTLAMESFDNVPFDFRPGLTCSCGFNTASYASMVYLYGPMCILLIFNLILFVYTTIRILTIQRQTSILHKTDSNATGGLSDQTDKQRFILYAKLFLLMGLTWITELVSWAIGGPDYYWYLLDVINMLRAVFIFILFICKKPVFKSLKHKFQGDSYSISDKTTISKTTSDPMSSRRSSKYRSNSSTSSSGKRRNPSREMEELKLTVARQVSDAARKKQERYNESDF